MIDDYNLFNFIILLWEIVNFCNASKIFNRIKKNKYKKNISLIKETKFKYLLKLVYIMLKN